MNCPLCSNPHDGTVYHNDGVRTFHQCSNCDLIFVPQSQHLAVTDEKQHYDKHNNGPENVGYRKFLSRAIQGFIDVGKPTQPCTGLDFGCGSQPVLQQMLRELSHDCVLYDKIYFPDESVWEKTYDFIIAANVVGHLSDVGKEFERLWGCLRPGGTFVVMTKRVESVEKFGKWHYRTDRTHIMFYPLSTLQWIGNKKLRCKSFSNVSADVVVYVKEDRKRVLEAPAEELCPVCKTKISCLDEFCRDQRRAYVKCPKCFLVFVPEAYHVSADVEKAEYDLHENNPGDLGYQEFLMRAVTPLEKEYAGVVPSPTLVGLDFGCGPGPTLHLLAKAKIPSIARVDLYDKFYFPNESVWDHQYNFITATEVIEHVVDSIAVLDRLWSCIVPGGIIVIMTKRVEGSPEKFVCWHYKNDPTHIRFFHVETFKFIEQRWGNATLDVVGADVVVFRKH
eukprot:PhF_6_TR5609/c0_g1_i1/m.8101